MSLLSVHRGQARSRERSVSPTRTPTIRRPGRRFRNSLEGSGARQRRVSLQRKTGAGMNREPDRRGGHMTAPDAAAERLHNPSVDELRRSLIPPVHRMVNGRQTRTMIRRARAGGPALYEAADVTTWLWSDLHLGDMASIMAFDRPSRTPYEMDQAMMNAWYELVGRRRRDHLPGRRQRRRRRPGAPPAMVAGGALGEIARARATTTKIARRGSRRSTTLALCGTDPPLALSHVPLRQMPPGATQSPRTPPRGHGADRPPHRLDARAAWLQPGRADLGAGRNAAAGVACGAGPAGAPFETGPPSRRRRATAIDFRGY